MSRCSSSIGLVLLLLCACSAGTWEDDPKNWERAFHSTKPAHVAVERSWYTRSGHWSYEFEYFFAIAPNQTLRAQLFEENRLERAESSATGLPCGDVPGRPHAWFAPKPCEAYEIWRFAGEPARHFKLLIDRESGALFMTDVAF